MYGMRCVIGLVLIFSFMQASSAQRSLALANMSKLTISKKVDVEQHNLVKLEHAQGELRLRSRSGLKFVQIRNTAEFILLPASYSAKTVDIAVLIEKPFNGYRLDSRRPALRIAARKKSKAPIMPQRCGKDCLMLGLSSDSDFHGVGLKPGEAIILPFYTAQ